MEITEALVRHLEQLSSLRLTPAARARMRGDLERIVEYVRQLESLDTDDVEPTSHVMATPRQPLRADEVRDSCARDEILANAPDAHAGFYRVPRFLGEQDAGEGRNP
jgi:aspartyl-tRNA(Asn)/glutamyl-tRNA(Gln) amidotransferase subunit C